MPGPANLHCTWIVTRQGHQQFNIHLKINDMNKVVLFGNEWLRVLPGGAVSLFYEALVSRGATDISISNAEHFTKDRLNASTVIYFRERVGEPEVTKESKTWKTEPRKFICNHAIDFSCSSTSIEKIPQA